MTNAKEAILLLCQGWVIASFFDFKDETGFMFLPFGNVLQPIEFPFRASP
jgi:hypothetical protein